MDVLVICEHSGVVRDAMIAQGHYAISCDLLPSDTPGPHHQGDAHDLLKHWWDLIIAHPTCTEMAVSGNRHYDIMTYRYNERLNAVAWTERLWDACLQSSDRVAFENPVSVLATMSNLPKPSYIQPYQFGHMEQKKTALYLWGLDPLITTNDVYDEMMKLPKREREAVHHASPGPNRWKVRSKTYQGIADAMAKQWTIEV